MDNSRKLQIVNNMALITMLAVHRERQLLNQNSKKATKRNSHPSLGVSDALNPVALSL